MEISNIENFKQYLIGCGEFIPSGDARQDTNHLKAVLKSQGMWSGCEYRYKINNGSVYRQAKVYGGEDNKDWENITSKITDK